MPWLALVRNVPPISPAQNVNGTVTSVENESTCSFPASRPAATMALHPPGMRWTIS